MKNLLDKRKLLLLSKKRETRDLELMTKNLAKIVSVVVVGEGTTLVAVVEVIEGLEKMKPKKTHGMSIKDLIEEEDREGLQEEAEVEAFVMITKVTSAYLMMMHITQIKSLT